MSDNNKYVQQVFGDNVLEEDLEGTFTPGGKTVPVKAPAKPNTNQEIWNASLELLRKSKKPEKPKVEEPL
jgi:hypothetical protein